MNMLMIAPLSDSRGKIRYYIGAQVDVSGLVKDCTDMDSLQRLVIKQSCTSQDHESTQESSKKDEFQELSEMLNMGELETVRCWGGRMHREQQDDEDERGGLNAGYRPRIVLKEQSSDSTKMYHTNGRGNGILSGIFQNVSVPVKCIDFDLLTGEVSVTPALPCASCTVCFAVIAYSWHAPVAIHGQNWWLESCPG